AGIEFEEAEEVDRGFEPGLVEGRSLENRGELGDGRCVASQVAVGSGRAVQRRGERGLELRGPADLCREQGDLAAELEADAEADVAAEEQARPAGHAELRGNQRQLATN